VNSGETFEPENTVPAPPGGFVRRVAHTPHHDGVRRGGHFDAAMLSGNLYATTFGLVLIAKRRVFGYNRDHSIALPRLTRSMSPILLRAGAVLYARVIKGKGTHRAAHYVEGIQ
jgi:hypothetical protein